MNKTRDLSELSQIYGEAVGLGPGAEGGAGLGTPVMSEIEIGESDKKDITGKVVLWKNIPWLVVGQQGVNVQLIQLNDTEMTAPISDVKLVPRQPKKD